MPRTCDDRGQREKDRGTTLNLTDFRVVFHANDSLPTHPPDPGNKDRFFPFLNLKQVSLPLGMHLPFVHEAALPGIECWYGRENELRAGRNG